MSQVNIIESAKVSSKEKLSIKIFNVEHILTNTTIEYKKQLFNTIKSRLNKKNQDFKHLNNIIADPTDKQDKNLLLAKATSISKTIVKIESDIAVILSASIMDSQQLFSEAKDNTVYSFPIGNKSQEITQLTNQQKLDKLVEEDFELFESKMYEVLTNNSADTVVPVLKNISERFGYRLSKIPNKK